MDRTKPEGEGGGLEAQTALIVEYVRLNKFPEKLGFLSEPHRYKVLYGGRGGIKSWSIAQNLPIARAKQSLRIPCARETMQSIRESVHQLLEDQIKRLGLQRL